MQHQTVRDLTVVAIMAILTIVVVWLPFATHLPSFWGIRLPASGMETVKKNYDGLNYVIAAKSLYHPQAIAQFHQSLPAKYFAAHLPGYPLTLRALAPLFGYLNAMLLATIIFTVTAALAFYWLLGDLGMIKERLWLTFVFLVLPPRWLVVHSVGAAEPLFITAILLSMLFFLRGIKQHTLQNFLLAGLFGALATITKTPGILLLAAYGCYFLWQLFIGKYWRNRNYWQTQILPAFLLGLIPLGLLAVFIWYGFAYHDFLAYFHSGDNIHLSLPPFQVFNSGQYWVGSIWLEDILFYFFLYTIAVIKLWQQKRYPLAWFSGIFLIATMCVVHRDIARYSLPIAPFALIAFHKDLTKPAVKIAVVVLLLPILLYSLNFIASNTFPVPTLAPYL